MVLVLILYLFYIGVGLLCAVKPRLRISNHSDTYESFPESVLTPFLPCFRWNAGKAGRQNWYYCRRTVVWALFKFSRGYWSCRAYASVSSAVVIINHIISSPLLCNRRFSRERGFWMGQAHDLRWYTPGDIVSLTLCVVFRLVWCRVLDPIFYGRYPEVLVRRLGDRLPRFSETEVQSLQGSVDFLGINHYTTHYALDQSNSSQHLDSGAASVGMHLSFQLHFSNFFCL